MVQDEIELNECREALNPPTTTVAPTDEGGPEPIPDPDVPEPPIAVPEPVSLLY